MAEKKSVCVFCGSSAGKDPAYAAQAEALGAAIGARGLSLVYGGSAVGLMGVMAASAMRSGARVTGIIPERINAMVEHFEISELVVVAGMHERKRRMHDMADCFVALPGGIGTYEEFFEALTWLQLGYHAKPLGILDAGGYFGPLLRLLEHTAESGFMGRALIDLIVVEDEAGPLLDRLLSMEVESPGKFHRGR